MAEHDLKATEGSALSPAGVLTDEQRATFRSAGLWMAIVGWLEVTGGVIAGAFWVLGLIEGLPGVALSHRSIHAVVAIGSLIIGGLTLIAARSFRRAAREPSAGLPLATAAVADLAELYERQVWLAFAVLMIGIGGALASWW